jgi:hypothetical protein
MRPNAANVRPQHPHRKSDLTRSIPPEARARTDFLMQWRRPHWKATCASKSRTMSSERNVLMFLDRLRARGPLLWWTISTRTAYVGPWRTWKEGGRS